MEVQNTHFVYDGEKIIISPNLSVIASFLMEIDAEIVKLLAKSPESVRANSVAIFSYWETLFCLFIAYEFQTWDKNQIIGHSRNHKTRKTFYTKYLLNSEIEWNKLNSERLKHFTADQMIALRNSLTHFFSLDKHIQLTHASMDTEARDLEKQTDYQLKFLSPEDLYKMVGGAGILIITEWTKGYDLSLKDQSFAYKEKMLCVNRLVHEHGAVVTGKVKS